MRGVLFVLPAVYEKQPRTAEELKAMWDSGKDFRILPEGPYVSSRDVVEFDKYEIHRVLGYVPYDINSEPLLLWEEQVS